MDIQKNKEKLAQAYGFEFPEDFWRFWEFYSELIKDKELFEIFHNNLGISLGGPFDFIEHMEDIDQLKLPIGLHYRFYMDPPEFFTILLGDVDGLHWGYWIDDIKDNKFFVASYYNNDAYSIDLVGRTILEAVRLDLEQHYGCIMEDQDSEESNKKNIEELDRLREKIMEYETSDKKFTGFDYDGTYGSKLDEIRKPAVKTKEEIGICIPDNLYKPWNSKEYEFIDYEKAKRLYEIAEDFLKEGFPGNVLEIGKNLWFYGEKYGEYMYSTLEKAYMALGREDFVNILKYHKENRDISNVDIRKFVGKEYRSLEKALKDKEGAIVLSLCSSDLNEVPKEISEFKNLTELNLYNNNITELNNGIFDLSNCKRLFLGRNKLSMIPVEIRRLKNLEEITLVENNITSMPDEISELKNLKVVYLMLNPISEEEKERIQKLVPWAKVY